MKLIQLFVVLKLKLTSSDVQLTKTVRTKVSSLSKLNVTNKLLRERKEGEDKGMFPVT